MRLYVAGIKGMVGSAIAQEAKKQGYEVVGKSSSHLNFTNRRETFEEIQVTKPDFLVVAAAKVGGIGANASMPVDFLSINLQIQSNLLDAAFTANVAKVLFLGSSCVYPRLAPQPISESSLLTGGLESTNEAYAIAKIAGGKLVQAYRKEFGRTWTSAMPTNLYGPGDNFDLQTSHVLPALLRKFHEAKLSGAESVTLWGSGTPRREFLHVDDLAKAVLFLLQGYDEATAINVGTGIDIEISELANLIAEVTNFQGSINWDKSKPDGTPRKLLDVSRINQLGWKSEILLADGIKSTYEWFVQKHS